MLVLLHSLCARPEELWEVELAFECARLGWAAALWLTGHSGALAWLPLDRSSRSSSTTTFNLCLAPQWGSTKLALVELSIVSTSTIGAANCRFELNCPLEAPASTAAPTTGDKKQERLNQAGRIRQTPLDGSASVIEWPTSGWPLNGSEGADRSLAPSAVWAAELADQL